MQITKDFKTIEYSVKHSTKRRIYLRVRDGYVFVTCPKKTTNKKVEELILEYFDSLYEKTIQTKKQEIIHFKGTPYKPKFFVGNCNSVTINDDEIWICSKKNDLASYKKILYEFYKRELINEVNSLISDAKKDFYEVKNFPTFEFRYLKSMFGNYTRSKHHIKLSTMLAKYDFKFIKYVLYHELSHVFEMNHSKKFYAVFDMKFPDLKMVKAQFKKIKYYDYL